MHVLVIPSWYKDSDSPNKGSFFRHQATSTARHAGTISIVYYECRSLKGFSLKKLTKNHFQIEETESDGVREFCIKGWSPMPKTRIGNVIWNFFTKLTVRKYIKKYGKPDLIHVQSVITAGYPAYILSKKYKIPYIVTEHYSGILNGTFQPHLHKKIVTAYQHAAYLLAVSQNLANAIEKISSKDVKVLPNFIDTEYFANGKRTDDKSQVSFISIGNLVKLKCFDMLLNAFAAAFKNRDNVHLKIGGTGPELPHLKAQAHRLGIEHRVEFLGLLSKEQVRTELYCSSAFVLASSVETFGIVLVEALAAGLPIIATSSGGPDEIIEPENGLLIPKNDEQSMTNALQKMADSYADYNPEMLRKLAYSKYDTQTLAPQLANIYSVIINKNRSKTLYDINK